METTPETKALSELSTFASMDDLEKLAGLFPELQTTFDKLCAQVAVVKACPTAKQHRKLQTICSSLFSKIDTLQKKHLNQEGNAE